MKLRQIAIASEEKRGSDDSTTDLHYKLRPHFRRYQELIFELSDLLNSRGNHLWKEEHINELIRLWEEPLLRHSITGVRVDDHVREISTPKELRARIRKEIKRMKPELRAAVSFRINIFMAR